MFILHDVSCVMCHVSHVTCHVSHVTCHLSRVICHMSTFCFTFLQKKEKFNPSEKIGQSGGVSWWRVCYQRGLPRLVNRPGVAGAVQ